LPKEQKLQRLGLYHSRYLSLLLLHVKRVAFLDEDFTIIDFLRFGLQQWNQSTSHILQQALAIAKAKNVEEMDSPKVTEEDQLGEDVTPSREDEAQYEDDTVANLYEPITQAEYIHLCDEVAWLQIETADHRCEYQEDQLRNEHADSAAAAISSRELSTNSMIL
jgi:hypothetical protein